jgi:phosphoribosylformylglycinamidine synthase
MKFGVVIFPGSNCDKDLIHVLKNVLKKEVVEIWHKNEHLDNFTTQDCIFLPGGFSFGDYLRTGAIARFSPIMASIIQFAHDGGKVIGICNGFQILCESGLLPGVLLRNKNQKFVCENKFLKVENKNSIFTNSIAKDVVKVPVAHAEGRFYASEEVIQNLEKNNQILFRYAAEDGGVTDESNFNGSTHNIAGICNERGNVIGMMPHPERCTESSLGNEDGLAFFYSLIA